MRINSLLMMMSCALSVAVIAQDDAETQVHLEQSFTELIQNLDVEVWECYNATDYLSWEIGDRNEKPDPLASLIGGRVPTDYFSKLPKHMKEEAMEFRPDKGILGKVAVGDVDHNGIFRIDGFVRTWAWGGPSKRFAVEIDLDGSGRYYELLDKEKTTTARQFFKCEKRSLTDEDERAARTELWESLVNLASARWDW